ncbi:MAG: amidohydrolase family protein [Victivallaceae bacterium]|nr:amidohydrolase family protein [Victivallaceae bacterium]
MFSILEVARDLNMAVNLHSTTNEDIEKLLQNVPNLKLIMAHPGETAGIPHRVELLNKWEDLHWDISGTGLFRWGMLKHVVEKCGTDKLLFGTDFPICSIAMQIYGVLAEHISDDAKAAIFSKNFLRLTTP